MDDERETRTGQRRWSERPGHAPRPETEPGAGRGADPGGPVPEGPVPEGAAEIPSRDVERRDGADRRAREEEVERERRVAARREADAEAARAREARVERRHHIVDRVTVGLDYAFFLLYGLLAVRFVLTLMGAAETAGFVQLIRGITGPFYAPFSGIVSQPSVNGGALDFPLIIAILAYTLLHIALRGLLRLIAGER